MKASHQNIEYVARIQQVALQHHEETFRRLERKMGNLDAQVEKLCESNYPNNQIKMVAELRSKNILTPLEAKKRKTETVETHKESEEVNP